MFQKAVTADEVLASRMICPPLTLFMLCSPNEGAAAVVLERSGRSAGGRDFPAIAPARQCPR